MVKKSLMICLAVSTEYWRVTDRDTDRQSCCNNIVRGKIYCCIQAVSAQTEKVATVSRTSLRTPRDGTSLSYGPFIDWSWLLFAAQTALLFSAAQRLSYYSIDCCIIVSAEHLACLSHCCTVISIHHCARNN